MTRLLQRASLPWPAVLIVAACAIALGLGLWQLQRRATKEELIAVIGARAAMAPQPLPDPSEWPRLRPRDYEYRHVVLEGIFAHDKEVLVFRASGGGTTGVTEPGYLVLTPLKLATGAIVVVNRGFVPQSSLGGIARGNPARASVTRVTGLMRAPEARNLFTPADNLAQGRGFTRDPAAIAAYFGLHPSAPFSIDADASADSSGWPRGGTTELRIPDNHLSYALTWFGLAATGAAVFGTFAWTQLHGRSGRLRRDQLGGSISQPRLVDRFLPMVPIRRSKSIHQLFDLVGRLVPTLGNRASGSDH